MSNATTPTATADKKGLVATIVKKGPKKPIEEYLAELQGDLEPETEFEEGGRGKIWFILKLYIRGYERKDIVAAGYNRSTVYRQCGEYEKLRKAPATEYQGFEIFESRVKRVMSRRKLDRDAAVSYIFEQDLGD